MKPSISLLFILTVGGTLGHANDRVPQIAQTDVAKRELTLIANPAAFPPSPAELAKIKIRVLKVEQEAAMARIAAIEARIRQIREESDTRIKALSDERDALLKREKEVGEALKATPP